MSYPDHKTPEKENHSSGPTPFLKAYGTLLLLLLTLTAVGCDTCTTCPPDPEEDSCFVAVGRLSSGNLTVYTSQNGTDWGQLGAISAPTPATTAPSLFWDGTRYHAAWFDSASDLWYGTSLRGASWAIENTPIGRYANTGSQPSIAVGASKIVFAYQAGGEIRVVTYRPGGSTPSSRTVARGTGQVVIQMDPSLTYGREHGFVLSYTTSNGRVHFMRSSDGSVFTEMPNTVGGFGRPPSLTFSGGNYYALARNTNGQGSGRRGFIHASPSGSAWANDGPEVKTWVGGPSHTALARDENGAFLVLEERGQRVDAHFLSPGRSFIDPPQVRWTSTRGVGLAYGLTEGCP